MKRTMCLPFLYAKIRELGGETMRKGQRKREWTVEQKLEIIHRYLDEHISVRTLGKEYAVNTGLICTWAKKYLEEGKAGLEPKKRSGNKFAALHRSKNLSELERLHLLVAKQEIEIARLKKGYWVEGAGANREYVTGQDVNTKSSRK